MVFMSFCHHRLSGLISFRVRISILYHSKCFVLTLLLLLCHNFIVHHVGIPVVYLAPYICYLTTCTVYWSAVDYSLAWADGSKFDVRIHRLNNNVSLKRPGGHLQTLSPTVHKVTSSQHHVIHWQAGRYCIVAAKCFISLNQPQTE